ncbi:hypothetical protein Mesil_3532 (plasmid) [Allomeiothermus silvanus DSM 9946]|uniref:Uncharacterized protein n=1 Tax=Allomeiothermus silvanus (strain ATCC 700542 / DSM 9946 / NBRC 106475 / NCIMB 13440 / VI-R2) TaxID=526227 RepID=D7BJH1_ALLS1|nr:CRISPR-associated protein Csx16 [Allomeiothermus silvanus]ADH65327.1 hypothetical protein Mesil_3532 [Allomeiothermus silvanus DSM 9946]
MIVITQHKGLVEYLEEKGFQADKVIPHATPEDIRGQDVVGVLPYHLAAEANTVTVVTLDPPPARGEDLSKDEVAARARGIETYVVLSNEKIREVFNELREYGTQLGLKDEHGVNSVLLGTLYREDSGDRLAVAANPDMARLVEQYSGKEPIERLDYVNPGTHLYGHAPMHAAAYANMVSVPEFHLTAEERKQRLSPEELESRAEWKQYVVYPESEYNFRVQLAKQQLDALAYIQEQGLYHDQTHRILAEAREVALQYRAEMYFNREEGQVVVTPDPVSDPYLKIPADRRMYLIQDIDSKVPVLETLVHENGQWKLQPSHTEATWAPVVRSLEELDRLTEGQFQHPRRWEVPDVPHYTLESRPGVVFVQEGDSWKALPDYKLFAKEAEPAPRDLEPQLEYVGKSPELALPSFAQWYAAHDLARAHSHEWGNPTPDQLADALHQSQTNREAEMRILSARVHMCGPVGGIFPEGTVENDRYVLSHTTGTGRLSWEVDQQGNLHLEVRRPSHHPLQGPQDHSGEGYAVLIAEYDSSTRQWKMREVGNDDALPRHVEVLLEAANATERTIPAELREELRAKALENEATQALRNMEALEERFGSSNLTRLSEAVRQGEITFDERWRNIQYDHDLEKALGTELLESFCDAYRDTPPIAEKIREYALNRENSREVSLER